MIIQIHFKSYSKDLLKKILFMFFSNNYIPKKFCNMYTVIKSPHVHKKSREQFQFIEYHYNMKLQLNKEILKLIKSCSFYGVQMLVSVHTATYFK